jgi:PAS domain S-box-containing protein
MEFEFSKKSGELITLLLSAEMINIGGEPCLLTITSNITERKRIEQELIESEEKFSKAFHTIPEAISIARLKDGVFIDVNESFCRQNEYTREEIIGHSGQELITWADPNQRKEFFKLVHEKGHAKNIECEFRKKSGEIHTALMSADIVNIAGQTCVLSVTGDITERKQMEQAIKESEEKYRNIVELAQDAIVSVNLKGQIAACNEAFGRLTGTPAKETIGKNFAELPFIVAKDIPTYMGLFKRALSGEKIPPMEPVWNHPDGTKKAIELRISIMKNNGKVTGIHALILDITERKMMEQALKESEEKFSRAFHAMPEAVSIARLKDGAFIEVNDSFISLNGYSKDELIGHSGDDLDNWVHQSEREKMVKMVKTQGYAKNVECEIKTKTGEIHTVLMSADIINIGGEPCMLCIASDITERKIMEQALIESEEKFSKAFHAIPETLSIFTLKEGRFIDVNESFLKLNRLTREEVIGRTGEEIDLLKPGDERNKLREILKEKSQFTNVEIEFKAPKSNKMLTFLFSADTIEIGGEPCLLIIGNEITKRKQAENELQQALTDLEQNSALLKATNKELESFSYSVSHDLRSPLRSIDGFSQALLEDYTDSLDEKAQDYLNRLRGASQKMGELIDGLLKLSRLTRSEMHYESVDLSSLANEIATRLQETHDKRDVQFIIDNNLKTTGDPQMLRVLLENLLGNAWKFTQNTPKAKIEFGSTTENGTKTFFIKDNGAGFDMAFKDKLFGAFQRLHDAVEYPGTGIGLATVQRIINRHGGNIRAEGATGKGAGFYFTLN